MGIVGLSNVQVHAHIGVLPEEISAGRWFSISIFIHFSLKKSGESDNVKDTIDYQKIGEVIRASMTKKYKLIESASHGIANGVLALYPQIQKMDIVIRKMHPFLEGQVEAAEITWTYPDDH